MKCKNDGSVSSDDLRVLLRKDRLLIGKLTSVLADAVGNSPAGGEGCTVQVSGWVPPLQRIARLRSSISSITPRLTSHWTSRPLHLPIFHSGFILESCGTTFRAGLRICRSRNVTFQVHCSRPAMIARHSTLLCVAFKRRPRQHGLAWLVALRVSASRASTAFSLSSSASSARPTVPTARHALWH